MERGLYAAASGMLAQQTIQETLAQNIANANTVGYKHDNPTFRAMQGMALHRLVNGMGRGPKIGDLGTGCNADKVYTDWQTGSLTQTGNPLDVSLDSNQFFTVRAPGGIRYTRAGDFKVDGAGNLMTSSGLPVLDANNQPIQAANGINLKIDSQGNLTSDGNPVARLKIVQADTNQMVKDGDSLFASTNPAGLLPAVRPGLHPGTLEQSNVNTVQDLVQLITVSRSFEIAQRALTTQDELLRHAANEVGKV